ncbi:MAG: saccharopine dehydrogenase NADP-binding domain-containing protein [Jaaginema sp. PMC 1079.18]|nr:saccharopine dehydrogenase NADP-binding domain-containing protein [Jaaginema sp. PMC 1080.18]MEC4852735.1 saccharopine dehydrogenase NADP-binding domain-containing protein [Jaaginema sp. PMC 1079.18]MEC4866791.1 saccharopine dehydrogenase NADP-binding domain-containing protein [Jaaginema sp. PMC 1078.18]
MSQKVLILGGKGRIGSCVAEDIFNHTDAEITVTSRQVNRDVRSRTRWLQLDLDHTEKLRQAIREADLAIHCAGPFHYRDGRVLKTCIEEGTHYLDVSDHRSFFQKVISLREKAEQAGITATLNTGIFPGISNSMVRQGVEQFDQAKTIHLSYVVAGSGGAGLTVLRTTFLGLRQAFLVWKDNQWQTVSPYSDRETVTFPQPYGKTGVYWFDMPEAYTFAESFPGVDNIITKFGSVPDLYNHLTWITAHVFPSAWIESSGGIEFFSKVSQIMTQVTDKFSGIGVAMRAEITGEKDGKMQKYCSTLVHENTAISAGIGTGTVAQYILEGKLQKPGIWAVEQALSTELFTAAMSDRGLEIIQQEVPVTLS